MPSDWVSAVCEDSQQAHRLTSLVSIVYGKHLGHLHNNTAQCPSASLLRHGQGMSLPDEVRHVPSCYKAAVRQGQACCLEARSHCPARRPVPLYCVL